MAETLLFVIFALIALVSGLMVVTARHPVKAVLSLVVTFVATAGTWMLLEAEFLSLVLIVVYVGAVMVLFLFVVMMLDVEKAEQKANFVSYWPFAATVAVLFFVMLVNLIGHLSLAQPAPTLVFDVSNVLQIGLALFTDYLYPFELAAVILLVAMIAAIALTFRGARPGKKTQVMSEQIKVKASERLRMVDIPTVAKTMVKEEGV
jgi:NADH-quinone oxidoreductase subunit J